MGAQCYHNYLELAPNISEKIAYHRTMAQFYLTTTLPYVNAEPHIGFALEILAADALVRYQKELGNEVFFNTGTDEHGQKIYQKALESNQSPQEYVDVYARTFRNLQPLLHLYKDIHFIRTTDVHHVTAAQTFWERCAENHNEHGESDIYKAHYETLYCVGCELEKQTSELVDGRCPLHPTQTLEERKEENYFFRFSRYQEQLLELYKQHPDFVLPEGKMAEITAFVASGLQDFSISRLATKMPWGIPVPGDPDHVMYVWFDALINYISTLGWPNDTATFTSFWPGLQVAGKDNLRQQAAMWQAMLLSAQLPPSKKILINGFISVAGQKMSKSLGNVISPVAMVERYGTEATRYVLLQLGPFEADMDVTWERFDERYTADLANSLGNTCSRIAKICEKNPLPTDRKLDYSSIPEVMAYHAAMDAYKIREALSCATQLLAKIETLLSTEQPWKADSANRETVLLQAVTMLLGVAEILVPFMPETAQLIAQHFSAPTIKAIQPLFPRLLPTSSK